MLGPAIPQIQRYGLPVSRDIILISLTRPGDVCMMWHMARIARVVMPGVPHHVTQRGNGRMETFFEDDDHAAHLALMADS